MSVALVSGCPSTSERQVQAGHSEAKAGRWREAVTAYQAAAEADPSNATTKALVGVAALSKNDPALATAAFSQALAQDRDSAEARLGLAQLAIAAADAGVALGLLDGQASNRATLLRARAFLLRGGPGDAEAALGQAQALLKVEPTSSAARYLEGSALLALGRFGEAQTALEALEKGDAASALGPYGLARLAAAQRRATDTLLYLKAARSRFGAAWPRAAVESDPAFAFLAGTPGFIEVVGP
ncbi:MAG: tetratricopeptide repeat protein [Myxococcaceae bacterium]|nr:tetratricopeptide repeat protein [Myxococcaceae bacterium]